jgi:DNA-binding transcriptional regulator GbsR (MarR family)
MASYEMEFSFGKKGMKQSDKSIDELNVRLVADLRNELDTLRTDAKKLLQRAESTENNTAPNKDMEQKIEQLIDEKKRMQNTLNTLHSQLTSFQKVAGIDYIPSETKVTVYK